MVGKLVGQSAAVLWWDSRADTKGSDLVGAEIEHIESPDMGTPLPQLGKTATEMLRKMRQVGAYHF